MRHYFLSPPVAFCLYSCALAPQPRCSFSIYGTTAAVWDGVVSASIFHTIALMATMLRLPYTTAIRPSLRGGFLYGLPCLCTISACTLFPQCAKSTMYPALPCGTRRPSVCRHDHECRGHYPQCADPSSLGTP